MRLAIVWLVAGCNLGIGSDPNHFPPAACEPGHARANASEPCVAPIAAIAIDGNIADWSSIEPITLGTTCHTSTCAGVAATELAIASAGDGDADLYLRVGYGGAPATDAELGVAIAASPIRPATAGVDRITASSAGLRYEKNGIAITTSATPATLAPTPDGFELDITAAWLTYQGAARISVFALRDGAEVATSTSVDACWSWRTGVTALDPHACEVAP